MNQIDKEDEAERCYLLGRDFYNKGEYEKALGFFKKSSKLKKDHKTTDFMVECEHIIFEQQQKKSSGDTSTNKRGFFFSQREEKLDENEDDSTAQTSSKMPSDSEAKRILRARSYYEILGISGSATEDVIKKTYKKLALKFHPDKNKEANAEEIFTKITEAYNTLVDPQKRQDYNDNPKYETKSAYLRKAYEKEHSYENFKNKFDKFNPYETSEQEYERKLKEKEKRDKCQRIKKKLFRLFKTTIIFALLICCLYYLRNKPSDKDLYAVYESSQFPTKLTTPYLNIPYYVGKKFQESITQASEIEYFGVKLEKLHINRLIEKCIESHFEKEAIIERANLLNGKAKEELLEEAENMVLADCQMKDELKNHFPFLFEVA